MRGVCGSSKAMREMGSHTKPVNVGESSVITHTGSVSVADSQSNTVPPKASLKSSDARKPIKQVSSSKTDRSSTVDISNCVKSSSQNSENSVRKEAKPVCNKEPAVSTSKEGVKVYPKFEINTLPGGKFGLKLTRPKPTMMKVSKISKISEISKISKISARNVNESENYTSEFQGGVRRSARKLVRGENSISNFNNIPILNTQIKRKLEIP